MKRLLEITLFIYCICSLFFVYPAFPEGMIWREGLLTAREPVLTLQVKIPEEIKQWIQEGIKNAKYSTEKNLHRGGKNLSLELTFGSRKDAKGSLFRIFLDHPNPKILTSDRALKDTLYYLNSVSFFENEQDTNKVKRIGVDIGPILFVAKKRDQWLKQGTIPIQVVLKHRVSKSSSMKQHAEVAIEHAALILIDSH